MRGSIRLIDPLIRTKPALVAAVAVLALSVAPAAHAQTGKTTFPYTFINPNGSKTIIPSEPKRVVLTGQSLQELDTVISLGVHPVGSLGRPDLLGAGTNGYPLWLNHSELSGVTNIGNGSPDFESVAALKPDLIVEYSTFPASEIAQLQAIAPTVEVDPGLTAPKRFPWEDTLFPLAPLFNATARAHQILDRIRDRTTALAGFAKGTSLAILFPEDGYQNFVEVTANQSLGALFENAGMNIAGPLPGGPAATPSGNILQSTELLPTVTASKVYFPLSDTGVTEAGVKALPLYPKIPAVSKGQAYFNDWWAAGPIGTADALSQLQKQMFGVTGFEATLAGVAKQKSSGGVADIDVGPTEKRVCWDIATTGYIGHPNTTSIVNAKGVQIFALGKGYHTTGCASIKRTAARKLLASPQHYRLSIDTTHTDTHTKPATTVTTVNVQGAVGLQSPSFFGNGKDKPFTFKP
jgi:iron complex transport system substrate-binding protein